MAKEFEEKLLSKISNFINSEQSLDKFYDDYYLFFVDKIPEDALDNNQFKFFGTIQEKWDFVTEDPSEDDRKYGYINVEEYKTWIRILINKLSEFNWDYETMEKFINQQVTVNSQELLPIL